MLSPQQYTLHELGSSLSHSGPGQEVKKASPYFMDLGLQAVATGIAVP